MDVSQYKSEPNKPDQKIVTCMISSTYMKYKTM